MAPAPKTLGYLFALAATVIWSGNFIVAKTLSPVLTPFMTSFLRWLIAFLCILPLGWNTVRQEWNVICQHWKYFTYTSILGITLFNTCIYTAGASTNATNMALIASSSPVWIALYARILLNDAISIRRAIGICIALLGTVLLVTRGNLMKLTELTFAIGDIWMLMAAIIFAIYSVLLRKKPNSVSMLGSLTVSFAIGVISLLPLAVWDFLHGQTIPITTPVITSLLYIGIFASLVSFFFWNKAVESIGPTQSALVYYSLPFFSAVEAFIILGDPISMVQVASGALILGGSLFAMKN